MAIVYGVSVGNLTRGAARAWMVSERFQRGIRKFSGSFQGDSKVSAVRALSLERKWISMGYDGFR